MRRRLLLLCVTFAVFGSSVMPVALADEPPPITVPTPTVPVPQPDPGPVAKPAQKPQPRPQPAPVTRAPVVQTSTPATSSRTVTPASSAPARVTPRVRVAPKPQKKPRTATHAKKQVHAKPKPSTHQGVKGAESTRASVEPPLAARTTSSNSKWMRTGLLVAFAAILGVVAFLFVSASAPVGVVSRRRRTGGGTLRRPRETPREVPVEVLAPRALRSPLPLPPAAPTAPAEAAPEEAEPTPAAQELPTEALLSDLAPGAAAAAVVEGAALQPGAADAETVEVAEEICAIGIWRGYVKSRFYAGLVGGAGEGIEYALAESEAIRLHGNGLPDRTPEAEAAHKALVDYLLENGWQAEPPSNGDGWYALRFRRAAVPAESHSA